MADFNVPLNRDLQLIKTAARYDSGAKTWLNDVANFVQNDSGIWVPVSSTNPVPAKLTGRKVEEIVLHDALAITDTDPHPSSIVDVSDAASFAIEIFDTHDQDIQVIIAGANSIPGKWYVDSTGNPFSITTSNNDVVYYVNSQELKILAGPLKRIAVTCKASIAPTSGSITVRLLKLS